MKLRWFLLSLISILLLSSPARATRLESWHFDPNHNQLDLTTDSGIQPRVFLIDNPKRLVIDLSGTTLDYPTTKQNYAWAIREIRVAQLDPQTTRLVIELAPGYNVSPQSVIVRRGSNFHWVVKLSSIEKMPATGIMEWGIGAGEQSSQTPISITPNLQQKRQVLLFQSKAPLENIATINKLSPPDILTKPINASMFAGVVPLGEEILQLKSQINALMARYSFLKPGMFFVDLETGNYLDISGNKVFPAASTIKFPILIALFEKIDAGTVKLNDTLVMRRDLVASGSGDLQYQRVGTKLTVLQTINKMISISDNTATNMIIDRLGGKAKLNQRFGSWGLKNTVIRNLLGDFKGTNTTSPADLVKLSALIQYHKLISDASRSQAIDILNHCHNKKLLAAGLGSGAMIAHKTGDIGFVIGDAGIIEMPNGKRYLAGIFVRRPYNDNRGRDFVRQVSHLVYTYLDLDLSQARN
ncbi:serine hydrolase [uncultured Nostoc sp.]|uniref:serine hydrolase n=1 Tax=uncultured Nostoc sp. TaxID=340711 RepID=UPI0035CB1F37